MPARNAPPVAAVVVGVLLAGAIVLVVMNRVRNPRPRPDDPTASAARHSSTTIDPVGRAILLEQAGQHREAAEVVRKCLDERPDDLEALAVLQRLLPTDDKAEIGDRLAKCTRPEDAFDCLRKVALDNGHDAATIVVLYAGLKKVRPHDYRCVCVEIQQRVSENNDGEAPTLFRDSFPATTDDGRTQLLRTWVEAMSSREKQLAAYAAVPDTHARTAFFALAHPLEYPVLAGQKGAEPRARLRALVAAHRRRSPDDPQGWYFEGVVLQAGRVYERAEKVYAEGQAKRPAPAAPPHASSQRQLGDWTWDYEEFRARRVECLYSAGKGLLAYETIGPAESTFPQLARLFGRGKDASSLGELVAAHRTKFPAAPELPYWDAEVLFLRGEYARAATALEAFRGGER